MREDAESKAQLRLVAGQGEVGATFPGAVGASAAATAGQLNNVQPGAGQSDSAPREYPIDNDHPPQQEVAYRGRDYQGPLSLGDPGVTASLWKEARADNDLFHDNRAWQPMDLITIQITENSEGSKEADTKIKAKSTVEAAISKLLGIEATAHNANPNLDPSALINAATKSEYEGTGETTRKGKLTATISGMVAEVLPSGVLRVEGQKIISVNSEEQIMVISGLVRPRDINSDNIVDSKKVANMRIDYYGKGTVGEIQEPGWLMRAINILWPF